MPPIEEPSEPWRAFFAEVDSRLSEDVHLHCCGGFVATQLYGIARTTSDVDFLGVVPNVRSDLTEIAGWLYALEAHDFALSKLERNLERDRDDMQQLAHAGHLTAEILRERYYNELRPNLAAHEGRHDLTLQLGLNLTGQTDLGRAG